MFPLQASRGTGLTCRRDAREQNSHAPAAGERATGAREATRGE